MPLQLGFLFSSFIEELQQLTQVQDLYDTSLIYHIQVIGVLDDEANLGYLSVVFG